MLFFFFFCFFNSFLGNDLNMCYSLNSTMNCIICSWYGDCIDGYCQVGKKKIENPNDPCSHYTSDMDIWDLSNSKATIPQNAPKFEIDKPNKILMNFGEKNFEEVRKKYMNNRGTYLIFS